MSGELAFFGGQKAVTVSDREAEEFFRWPIITKEDEDAVLEVLRAGTMSGTNITSQFEKEYAAWQGTKYALAFNNGTSALLAAMFACGIGAGDEIICQSVTYWASILPAYSLGATAIFADIDPDTLCIDPGDIEKRISKNTKAIMVVHYIGHPADMDAIMAIAKNHNLKVIEDVSHAQGGLYRGKKLGTFGDVSAMSLMSGKSFPTGEGGILVTDSLEYYERAIAFGHYNMYDDSIKTESLKPYAGLPMGGIKGRMHQLSAAVGRVQLKYNDQRTAEIRKAMNCFWDLLEGVPGIRAHRVSEAEGSNMAGWYAPHGLYRPEELEGLSITRFCQAVSAEGVKTEPGCNAALHSHPLFQTVDIYRQGKPTRIANTARDVRELDKNLPVSNGIGDRVYTIPWFKHYKPVIIEQYANAFKKVSANYRELLKDDPKTPAGVHWHFYDIKK
ncbi:MAG: DegT/DnrJ/EryC1/StrS family aminotransferase [Treponema sp.]|jgi:dTDP-4-amino-4,6-dideoxygalactose transaminase|nr:DegT/DnrJ/EryC1/StrS family aminotransferase [Treponema sp.]